MVEVRLFTKASEKPGFNQTIGVQKVSHVSVMNMHSFFFAGLAILFLTVFGLLDLLDRVDGLKRDAGTSMAYRFAGWLLLASAASYGFSHLPAESFQAFIVWSSIALISIGTGAALQETNRRPLKVIWFTTWYTFGLSFECLVNPSWLINGTANVSWALAVTLFAFGVYQLRQHNLAHWVQIAQKTFIDETISLSETTSL